ncbi:CarboxypepD_reg-like domain-containing protein [Flavobacteriaceae bacterium MAR_2010_188]|nr:CarboxypepD_reg-like domain-containing protein [Flavobacteriaceae bacterium MAR_2010_188]
MRLIYLFSLSFCCLQITLGQNITAKVVDKTSKQPIPYASVQTAEHSGTMTNEEGFFSINQENVKNDRITISCMGYVNKTVTLAQLKQHNNLILLDEGVNQLAEVYLSNRKPNADSIIARVKRNLSKNYNSQNLNQELFYRETTYTDFEDLDLEIEKASHVKQQKLDQANSSLDSLGREVKKNRMIFFKEFKGNLLTCSKDSTKLNVLKATKLVDKKKDFSIESIQEKTQEIILQYLDEDKTYKLKSGLFTVEDEMSLNDLKEKNKEEEKAVYSQGDLRSSTKGLLNNSQFYNDSFLNQLLDSNLYEYEFVNVSYINQDLIYIVDFLPDRSKSKYAGRLYINDKDYAIIKADYSYSEGKRGSKLNLKLLLGVKYIENLKQGTIIFQQDSTLGYQPNYIKEESGSYFYVSRPLKFIENSISKNKVSLDFVIEGDLKNKKELLFSTVTALDNVEFKNYTEPKEIPYLLLSQYDSSIWKNTEVLEPLSEMKDYNSEND